MIEKGSFYWYGAWRVLFSLRQTRHGPVWLINLLDWNIRKPCPLLHRRDSFDETASWDPEGAGEAVTYVFNYKHIPFSKVLHCKLNSCVLFAWTSSRFIWHNEAQIGCIPTLSLPPLTHRLAKNIPCTSMHKMLCIFVHILYSGCNLCCLCPALSLLCGPLRYCPSFKAQHDYLCLFWPAHAVLYVNVLWSLSQGCLSIGVGFRPFGPVSWKSNHSTNRNQLIYESCDLVCTDA